MGERPAGLLAKAALFVLAFAMTSGVEAKPGSLTIRLKAVKGQVEIIYRGKRLTDSGYAQLCAAGKARKAEINFQRDTMNSSDTMAALLKEADCLGAKRSAGIDRKPAPKSATQTHARQRRTTGTQP